MTDPTTYECLMEMAVRKHVPMDKLSRWVFEVPPSAIPSVVDKLAEEFVFYWWGLPVRIEPSLPSDAIRLVEKR